MYFNPQLSIMICQINPRKVVKMTAILTRMLEYILCVRSTLVRHYAIAAMMMATINVLKQAQMRDTDVHRS